MTLKEYLDREPSGDAFIEMIMWLKSLHELCPKGVIADKRKELLKEYCGDISGL